MITLGGVRVRHVLDPFGNDTHAIPDHENPRRRRYALIAPQEAVSLFLIVRQVGEITGLFGTSCWSHLPRTDHRLTTETP
jgi:hypothetical protein